MKPRIALFADYLEEGWTSMDHYAAMLARQFDQAGRLQASVVRPEFHRRLGRLPWLFGPRHGHTLDRYWNRYSDYPRAVTRSREFDVFHVLDQTYAHVVLRLPADRTVVTCHDLDFADPPSGTRFAWLVRSTGAMTLPGLRSAARVICDSDAIRWELQRRGVVEPERLVVVPLGVEADFARDGPSSLPAAAEALLTSAGPGPGSRRMILHVGAMVARKRLDLVLRSFARVVHAEPTATLVRAGGALSPMMRSLARDLGVDRSVIEMPFLSRAELAALYRRAHVFLLCSETEGFGLPVLEAMASGLPVVTRDLPAIREVAGDAVRLVRGDDPEAFAASVLDVLRDEGVRGTLRQRGLERAAGYGWADTAARTQRVYEDLLASHAPRADRA